MTEKHLSIRFRNIHSGEIVNVFRILSDGGNRFFFFRSAAGVRGNRERVFKASFEAVA